MNHFLHSWGTPLSFVQVLVLVAALMGIAFLVGYLLKRLGISEAWLKRILFVVIMASIFAILFGTGRIMHGLNDGRVMMLYVGEHGGRPSLKVGLLRRNARRGISYSTYKFKTYDLETGELLELEDLGERSVAGDYEIFGSYGRNPIEGLWTFDPAEGSEGKLARLVGVHRPADAKPAVLLEPELIRELDGDAPRSKRTWLQHRTALFGPSTYLLTYVDEFGRPLERLDLGRIFEDKKTRAIAALSNGEELLLFITRNDTDLTALRTDPTDGEVLGRIEYLK